MGRFRLIVALVIFSLLVSGCGYTRLAGNKLRAFFNPSHENIKMGAPENCILVNGQVSGDGNGDVQLLVVAVADESPVGEIVDYSLLSRQGPYYLYLPEGRYKILVFADLNHNLEFNQDELVGQLNNQSTLQVGKDKALRGVIHNQNISVSCERPQNCRFPFHLAIAKRKSTTESCQIPLAEITTLDDDLFGAETGFLGLYQPAAYFERVNRFFFMLEEYDPAKIPVVFVHGAGGTPDDWRFVVEGLDRRRFQPWFFYYPSGVSLETVSDIFYDIFLSGRVAKDGKLVIASHSIGGLVTRSALNRYEAHGNPSAPRLFVSFCTPYGGVESAAKAARLSPVVVPSWKDIASNSDFLNGMFGQALPVGVQFNLFFAYRNGNLVKWGPNDDGAITLKSQLSPQAQAEASRLHGFDETHSGILNSPEARTEFIHLLDEF